MLNDCGGDSSTHQISMHFSHFPAPLAVRLGSHDWVLAMGSSLVSLPLKRVTLIDYMLQMSTMWRHTLPRIRW